MRCFKFQNGYIAIVSAVIISGFVLVLTLTVGLSSFFTRDSISRSYSKEVSRALTQGCMERALLNFSSSASYAGNETIMIASDTCVIAPFSTTATSTIISVRASVNNVYTNLRVTLRTSDFAIVSWEERVGQ